MSSTVLYLVYLPSANILSIVSVYQLAHIYMSPGIEPENLIRSTLIRSPPGAFFRRRREITKQSRKYSIVPPMFLTATTGVET